MPIKYWISRPPTEVLLPLLLLVGCNGGGSTLKSFVPRNIVDRNANAEIREAALEDDSFPSATEAVPRKE